MFRSPIVHWAPTRPLGAAVAVAVVLLAACGVRKPIGSNGDASIDASAERPPTSDQVRFLEALESPADFARVQGEGGEVKYLGTLAGGDGLPPVDKPCMFQNTALYPGHITFLRSFPDLAHLDFGTYLNLVMKQASRVLWGGELKFFSGAVHPRTGVRGVLAYFVYADDAVTEALTLDQLVEVDGLLKGCVPYARDLMVVVGMNDLQATRFQAQAIELEARGVDVIDPRSLQPGSGAEGYSLGEGYGYLRMVPRGLTPGDHGPRDVLVAESAREDLSLVAGLITVLPQNLHSHVNLRLRDKMIPNARVPDVLQNPVLSLLEGKLVHVTVAETAVRIEPARLEVAMAFWAARRPIVSVPVADLAETRLRNLDELRASDNVTVGSKAANLGELTRVLPPGNAVAEGFAIPFSVYVDFMGTTGLRARVETWLTDPRVAEDARFRRGVLEALRTEIEAAAVAAPLLARIEQQARAAFGDFDAARPLRFRSSSNIEDSQFISGAGLHDSARGCLADDMDGDPVGPSRCLAADEKAQLDSELARRTDELAAHPERDWLPGIIDDLRKDLTNERTVARALKKVYASLWNDRAFEERAYWGIDHRAAFMGVAVEPSFVLEKLDAVAVTNLEAGPGGPLYRVVAQRDGQGVVRPADPTLVPETMTFRRGADDTPADVRVVTMSSLSGEALWPPARLAELASLLFAVQDHFAAVVYPELSSPSLDLEIKMTRDDRVVIKQVRPFLQGTP